VIHPPGSGGPLEARAEVERVAAAGTRIETPCGAGRLVWYLWGQGRPLLLLHGGSGSWTHWIRNVETLAAAGYQVIAPDLPGSGDSALPPDGSDADVIPRWLVLGLEQILPGVRALDVVAFSFGTVVAVLLARDWPGHVARLVLTGPPVFRDNPPPFGRLRAWRDAPEGPARDEVHRHNLLAFMLNDPTAADALAVETHGRNVERDRMTKRRLARTSLVHDTIRTLPGPLHLIVGERDFIFEGRWDQAHALLDEVPALQSRLLIEGAGHWVSYEAPDRYNDAVLRLLKDLPNASL
jgi:pimeloyl-ACP methyl ester carboxylesterase